MDEVAVEHTSSPLQQTQTGRVRTPGPPTSFSLSFPLPATVRLPWNHSSLVTPCDPDIPCQVPWVYRSELVFGVEPSPISFAICIRMTLAVFSITVPWDFHTVGKLCRLRDFCGFSGGIAFLCFCAWRIWSNRYKIKLSAWLASAGHTRLNASALNPSGTFTTG